MPRWRSELIVISWHRNVLDQQSTLPNNPPAWVVACRLGSEGEEGYVQLWRGCRCSESHRGSCPSQCIPVNYRPCYLYACTCIEPVCAPTPDARERGQTWTIQVRGSVLREAVHESGPRETHCRRR